MTDAAPEPLPGAAAYMAQARACLDRIAGTQAEAIGRAVTLCVDAVGRGGIVYLFGTGHSHTMAEEGHYRAGGLAAVCPVLSTGLMLHEGAVASTRLERLQGIGATVLGRYRPQAGDVLFVFSNSGVNAVPVETAAEARRLGLSVVAVVSAAYAARLPVGPAGAKLADIADVVIDNQGPPGDALVELPDPSFRAGPVSTLAGAFILNAVLTETAWRLAQSGRPAPVYTSANMPGAAERNERLVEQYRPRNPHL